MKKNLSKILMAIMLLFLPEISSAQVVTLGAASDFVLFTTVGPVTNSGTNFQTRLIGKVGSNSGSSTGFGNVNGTMHSGDAVTIAAAANLLTAYTQLNTATNTGFPSSALGNGATMTPGVYSINSAATLNGVLTLDAQGNSGAVFIFKINGALSASANTKVRLINGALACNVYWKTEDMVSIGSGSTIRGTIVTNNGAISWGTLDTLEGRALSINGAITLNSLTGATPIGCGSPTLTGPPAPTLGAVGIFAIFSSIGPVTNGLAITRVVGDVGTNLGLTTGYNPLFVNGTIHPIPDGTTNSAVPALAVAYAHLHALPNDIVLIYPALLGHGLKLTPHTYILNGATALTDTLYLDAQGNNNAVFVIKVNGALSAVAGAHVKLLNGAQTKNVYWKVSGAVDLANNTTFRGNVLVSVGAIDIVPGANFFGRALTSDGAITTNGAIINAPVTPEASVTGDTQLCVGSSTQLLGLDPGGTWTATNPRATVSNTGLVTGVSAGLDSIIYTVTNGFGTTRDTQVISIVTAPNAGTITGPSNVCIGSSILLTNTAPNGTWTASNATATVVNGLVTGISAGTNTIKYTVTNACGTAEATKVIAIYAAPTVNTPANQVVCAGAPTAPVNFTGAIAGTTYNWTNDNTNIGLAPSGSGNIPSFTATNATTSPIVANITVTPVNGCTGSSKTFSITVNPSPNANAVPNQAICNTASTTAVIFTGTVSGTTFAWTNNNTSIGLAASGNGNIPSFTGTNTTSTPAVATIVVTPTANGCTGSTRTFTITVNPTPNAATVANQAICNGAPTNAVNYTGTVSGTSFAWTNNNTSIGLAASGNGNIPSFAAVNNTSVPTVATIVVTPSANGCTGSTKTFSITVNPTPNAATIPDQAICNGAPTNAVNYTGTVSGTTYAWTNNNTSIGLAASGNGNIPSFTATNPTTTPEVATIVVTPSANGCTGSTKTFTITANPTPTAAPVANQAICNGAPTTAVNFTGPVTGTTFTWTNSNTSIGLAASGNGNIPSFAAVNSTSATTIANIVITPTANGCTGGSTTTFSITVYPTPNVAAIGNKEVCNGNAIAPIIYTGTVTGTSFAWTNNNTSIGLANAGTGTIPSFTAINTTNQPAVATITVTPSANGCTGTARTFTITVNSTPTAPVLSLTTPATVCHMTYFRNFGAATLPPAGIEYTWSTINAAVSDTGSTEQYALINFKTVGTATVILTATQINTGCFNTASYNVDVKSNVADVPAKVIYFNKSFVCLQNDEEAYAWGYDDINTLAPTVLTGEMNQDYVNANPDFDAHNYWVMVTHNGCIQKTYYNKPEGAQMKQIPVELTLSPNPASQQITIELNTVNTGDMQMEIYSALGQKMYLLHMATSSNTVDISSFPTGVYVVICYHNGERFTARFIKN